MNRRTPQTFLMFLKLRLGEKSRRFRIAISSKFSCRPLVQSFLIGLKLDFLPKFWEYFTQEISLQELRLKSHQGDSSLVDICLLCWIQLDSCYLVNQAQYLHIIAQIHVSCTNRGFSFIKESGKTISLFTTFEGKI